MGPTGYQYGYGNAYGQPPPPPTTGTRPAVWPWYVAYAVLMALLYLLCLGGGVVLAFAGDNPEERIKGVILAVVGLPLMAIYAAAPLMPKRPWAWFFHLVLICFAMTSACCIPAAVPLLIFWLKPETKAFFGRV